MGEADGELAERVARLEAEVARLADLLKVREPRPGPAAPRPPYRPPYRRPSRPRFRLPCR